MEQFVLGGGLAGLIYAYYNKDFKVLTDKIGGQASSGFTLGPRIIQEHRATHKLLQDLGYETFVYPENYDYRKDKKPMLVKTAKIGYFVDGRVQDEPDHHFRKAYYMKSRCLTVEDAEDVPDSVMSDNKKSIEYYAISHEQLASILAAELQKQNRLFVAKVNQVDLDESLLYVHADGKMQTMAFERLVNTAPFPMFFKMCNPTAQLSKGSFDYEPKYFVNADKHDFKDYIKDGYDYIYFAGNTPWHRITVGDTNVTVEITGAKPYGEFHHIDEPLKWTANELKVGQIKKNFNCVTMEMDNTEIPNIRNIGRYAVWNHEVKTQQVVEAALKGLWQ